MDDAGSPLLFKIPKQLFLAELRRPLLMLVCMLQTFLQRCKNFLQGTAATYLVMPKIESSKKQFMKESGLRVKSYEQGYSAAVAAISAADWAIEFPRPMPPNVQVSPAPNHVVVYPTERLWSMFSTEH